MKKMHDLKTGGKTGPSAEKFAEMCCVSLAGDRRHVSEVRGCREDSASQPLMQCVFSTVHFSARD